MIIQKKIGKKDHDWTTIVPSDNFVNKVIRQYVRDINPFELVLVICSFDSS